MKELRNYILEEIKTRLPEYVTVRMFNDQYNKSNNDEIEDNIEQAFGYPSCFVEFEQQEVRNMSLGIKHVDMLIRLHLGFENYSLEREQVYDLIDKTDSAMQGMRGSETDTVQFSSLIENNTLLDGEFNNVNNPVFEYLTTYTRLNAYKRKNNTVKPAPTNLQTDGTII